MTKNKAQKRAARAAKASTGRSYTGAAREVAFGLDPATGIVSARQYANALVAEFQRIGWTGPDNAIVDDLLGTPQVWCGPAQATLTRDVTDWSNADPDDASTFDQSIAPLVEVCTPPDGGHPDDDGARSEAFAVGNLTPPQMVAAIRRLVATSREAGLATKQVRARCLVCDEAFAEHHMLWMGNREPYCPECLFQTEEGYGGVTVGDLIEFYRELEMSDSSYPSKWTSLAVLSAQATDHSPRSTEDLAGDNSFVRHVGIQKPSCMWMWLPQHPQTPAVLSQFGAGATVGAIVAALDQSHPDLRARYAALLKPFIDDVHANDPDGDWHRPADTWVQDYWETIVAFAVGFLMTAEAEGRAPRPQWADRLFVETFYEYFWMEFDLASGGLSDALGRVHLLVDMIAPGFPVTPGR